MFIRKQIQILERRIERDSKRFIQVLYGPRQVGKSTLVQQFVSCTSLPVHFVTADAVASGASGWIAEQWEVARLLLRSSGASEALLVIDEIQKIANWSEWVKKEWDADQLANVPLKVIVLGSSRLLLQQGLTESLAGRFETTYIGHWSLDEMREAFGYTAEQFVWYGGYPGAAALIEEETRWRQYIRDSLIETGITKDILMLTRVHKPSLMLRLFELGCQYSGQILSYNKIMGQLQDAGNTTTLAHYLHLLDAAGMLGGLEKYSPNRIRQRSSSPKFQVYNNALMSGLEARSRQQIEGDPRLWGRWVESAVGAHLLNYSVATGTELFYWRDRNREIDFVLCKQGKVIGLEVKSGVVATTSGMSAFRQRFQPDRVYLVGRDGMPWQTFLATDPDDLF